jgi:hypothetical protein
MYVCEPMNHSLKVSVSEPADSARPKFPDPDFESVHTDPKFGSEYSMKKNFGPTHQYRFRFQNGIKVNLIDSWINI